MRKSSNDSAAMRAAGVVVVSLIVSSCTTSRTAPSPATVSPEAGTSASQAPAPPAVTAEFRGAWIATVDNIDWPSRRDLTSSEQQAELRRLLDRAVALRLNAVILQVRPAADALYDSPFEPWSEYLTGVMGRGPEPYYDPLAFAVEEAHHRGLELHAWFNPFRAHHPTGTSPIDSGHVSVIFPQIVREYGEYLWLDPGSEQARRLSLDVILDVVRRYDIDGVHLDDYFYPYRISDARGRPVDFPDDATWNLASKADSTLRRGDWRRSNIDRFVQALYREVKSEKPWVRVGISPFGIWRPGHPEQIQGLDTYTVLFTDARKWLRNGWVDYLAPQLYWEIDRIEQSYPVLLQWWLEQNEQGRHVWPGNYTSRVLSEGRRRWSDHEIIRQIEETRARAGATGNIHFSMKALLPENSSVGDELARGPYDAPAVVPEAAWLGNEIPGAPALSVEEVDSRRSLAISPSSGAPPSKWVVRIREGSLWSTRIIPAVRRSVELSGDPDELAVSAISRTGLEGPLSSLVNESGVYRREAGKPDS